MASRPSFGAIKLAVDSDLRILKLMARKMDLREAKDPDHGANALHFAAFKGRLDVCRFLVEESGFDVNCTDGDGATPAIYAAAEGKMSVLRYFLDHGADTAMASAIGGTPLHYAAECGHHEAVRLLFLSRGSDDVDALNYRRVSPLQLAAGNGQAVKILLEHGADPNRDVHNMFTPLVMACCAGSLKCAKLLVEAGADVNFTNPYGPTALMMAAGRGFTDIVKLLLEAGADPNISDESGSIAIMYAAANDRLCDLVEILFPRTKPIAALPNWSVGGIIDTMRTTSFKSMETERTIADAKPQGNEAFAKGDYLAATMLYDMAIHKDPLDATLFSNRSLCWLRLGDGERALLDAQQCKTLRPCWSKAWYREGTTLSLLKDYKGAVNAFTEALKLEPANYEVKKALREATDSLMTGEQNP